MTDEPVTIRNYLRLGRHALHARRAASLGAGVDEERRRRADARRRPARAARGHRRPARRGQLGHAAAAAPGLARRAAGRRVDARRRRVDPPPAGRPGGGAAAARWGRELEARDGRFPPLHGPRRRASRDRLRAAGGERAGQVVRADRRACSPTGTTTVAEPRPSRDHTERMLRRARVPVRARGSALTVSQVDELELDEHRRARRPSSAAFVVAAACSCPARGSWSPTSASTGPAPASSASRSGWAR